MDPDRQLPTSEHVPPARHSRGERHSPILTIALITIALICAVATACAPRGAYTPSTARGTLRVVSYNIHAGKDARQQPNLERVAAILDSLDADIVLLQEVDRGTERSGHVDQLAELERLTAMHGAFAKSLDYQGGDYGIAALSHWPIDSAETVPLSTEPPADRGAGMYEPRVAIHIVVSAPMGRVHVIGTHLGAEGVSTFRDQEARDLLEHVRARVPADAPVMIGGDFNSTPDSDVHAVFSRDFRDSWQQCGTGDGYTFPADSAVRRIDYIYARGLQCATAKVVDTQASDHRPLFVTLRARDSAADSPR